MPQLSIASGYPRAIVVSVACSFQEAREAVSSSVSEVYLLRGISGSFLGLGRFIVLCFSLSCCVFLHIGFSFLQICFSVKVIASQPVRDSGCQYQKPFSGLDCLCVILS